MIIKLADLIIEVKSRYKYTFDMCSSYLYDGDEKPCFTTFATNEQLLKEQKKTPEFTMDILENTCIYRNICNEILKYDGIFLHSAAISVDNMAYLFSADSGTGKTTHMNLWLEKFKERSFIINGDKPILRKNNGTIYVYGTPWCGKEGYNKNIRVPLKSIGILERSQTNATELADKKEAVVFLLTQTTKPTDAALTGLMLSNLDMLLSEIPVYKIKCNMDKEAADVSYNAMNN